MDYFLHLNAWLRHWLAELLFYTAVLLFYATVLIGVVITILVHAADWFDAESCQAAAEFRANVMR